LLFDVGDICVIDSDQENSNNIRKHVEKLRKVGGGIGG
jgi:hypothetical protein